MADDNEGKPSGIEKYRHELEEDTEVNIRNIRDKSLRLPAMQAKWVGYYVEEKQQLKKVNELRQKYLTNKASKEMDTDAFAKLKTNAAPDETLKKIDKLKNELELTIEYIREAMNILSGMGYNIKNSIEIFKMENA